MMRHCGTEMVRFEKGLKCQHCGKYLEFHTRKRNKGEKLSDKQRSEMTKAEI